MKLSDWERAGFVIKDGEFVKTASGSKLILQNPMIPKKKRIRQSSKPLLNKLEWDFFDSVLRPKYGMLNIHTQAMRFKLGNGIWFKVDFVVFDVSTTCITEGSVRAYEVKGPFAHRGGFENLKVAASLYLQIIWYLVWKENGQWQEQRVLP